MELWLILTLVSVVVAGLNSFLYKIIGTDKNIEVTTLNVYVSIFSTVVVGFAALMFGDFNNIDSWAVGLGLAVAVTYIISNLTRAKGLGHLDSVVFFPLYRVLAAILIILVGVIFFQETISSTEAVGILLGMIVPLLLLTKKDIKNNKILIGLYFLGLTIVFGSLSSISWKLGADLSANIWAFVFFCELFAIPTALWSMHQTFGKKMVTKFKDITKPKVFTVTSLSSIFTAIAGIAVPFAYYQGGELSNVYIINSFYVLIPVVLSIIFFKEKLTTKKFIAIVLSIVAIFFFA